MSRQERPPRSAISRTAGRLTQLTQLQGRLYKEDVESTDYATREYGATPEQIAVLEKAVENRYQQLRRSGKLLTVTADELRGLLEEASHA